MIAHEAAGQGELLPLAEADLHASGQVGPSCVSSPAASRSTTSPAPARSTAAATAGSSSSRGRSPTPTVCRARNSNRKKS